jgi:hypothetical protein
MKPVERYLREAENFRNTAASTTARAAPFLIRSMPPSGRTRHRIRPREGDLNPQPLGCEPDELPERSIAPLGSKALACAGGGAKARMWYGAT